MSYYDDEEFTEDFNLMDYLSDHGPAESEDEDSEYGELDVYHGAESDGEYSLEKYDEGLEDNEYSGLSSIISENKDLINKTLDLGMRIADVYAESQRLNAQVEFVKEAGKVKMAQIAAKFLTTKDVLDKVFSERDKSLSRHYKALDYGIETGNTDLIIKAMSNISSVVVTSPLADITSFIERMEDKSKPLLDF